MKIVRTMLGALAVLLGLTAAGSVAEAGHGRYGRYHHYDDYGHHPRDRYYGWPGLQLFGFGNEGGRCDQLLRQAIEIDTPDPRYWNRYDACIGI